MSKLQKRLKMNRSTVWKIIKKFKETGNTLDRERRGRKRSICTPQLIKNTREKLRRNHRQSCRTLAEAAGVGKSTMHQVLRDDLGRKPFKMMHRHELTDRHVAMRAQKCRNILKDIDEGTLANLIFTNEKFNIQQVVNQQNHRVWASSSATEGRIVTRRQNPQSVMVWAAVTATGRSPSFFSHLESN